MKHLVSSLILAFAVCSSCLAATVGGISLPKSHGDLELNGAGLLRKGFFFKIYVGALYVAETECVVTHLDDLSKQIDIHYFHKTHKKHMLRVANKTLKKNLYTDEYETLLPKIQKLHNAFLHGRKGSVASIRHEPGVGLIYGFNNEPVITIPGDDFANAYFSIWLGERPSSQTIKEAMLNKG